MLAQRLNQLARRALLLLALLAVAQATATGNGVPASGADVILEPITLDAFVPPECEGMALYYIAVLPAYGAWQTFYSNVLVIGTDYADTFTSNAGENTSFG